MNPKDIQAALGWEHVELEPIELLPAPEDAVMRGLAGGAALPTAHFCDSKSIQGIEVARYADDARCVVVDGSPLEVGGATTGLDGGTALDGRDGAAWAVLPQADGSCVVVFNRHGEVQLWRRSVDPVVLRLQSGLARETAFEAALLQVADLVSGPGAPDWLDHGIRARWSDDPVDQLEAIGLAARHGTAECVAKVTSWCAELGSSDLERLEGAIDALRASAFDHLFEWVESEDPSNLRCLVLVRDRIASLAAIRSLAGPGSGVHARIWSLDKAVMVHRMHFPEPDAVGLSGDRAILAAADMDPDAWWSDFAA